MIRLAVPLLLCLWLAGCGGDDDDGGAAGGMPDACAGGSGCGEPCNAGNSYGVGMYCTAGGGECADTPGRAAPFCTVDNRADADAFCTRPCDPEADVVAQCGEDAACRGDGSGSGPSGCVPNACL